MDTYLRDYMKLSAYGEFIGELAMPPTNSKNTSTKKESSVKAYSLRGLGRFRPTYNVINEVSDLDKLRMSNPGPIRGFGRVGSFYSALAYKFSKQTIQISEKKYNYWRGAGKKSKVVSSEI